RRADHHIPAAPAASRDAPSVPSGTRSRAAPVLGSSSAPGFTGSLSVPRSRGVAGASGEGFVVPNGRLQ
ncbi:hypothetical protein G3I38_01470, partial [Streptomyces sp. SID7958]|nr:hypothetical protein [Streptomyces sp. SID7958]